MCVGRCAFARSREHSPVSLTPFSLAGPQTQGGGIASIFNLEDEVGATPREWQSQKMEGAWVLHVGGLPVDSRPLVLQPESKGEIFCLASSHLKFFSSPLLTSARSIVLSLS